MNINKIRFIGRYIIKDNKPYFSYSGCGFIFSIKPLSSPYSFTLSLDSELKEHDTQYIVIYINDKFYSKEKLLSGNNKLTISLDNKEKEVIIRVIKVNETYVSSIYLDDIILNNARLIQTKHSNKPLIGFFGDSLTCGYGLLDYKKPDFSMEGEDFSKTYAYLACFHLNMDYTVVARSGISMALKIYIDQLFKEIYDTVDMFNKCEVDKNLDYAVINLGTNDNGAYSLLKENQESALKEFKKEYIALLERIIKDNPHVKIILCHSMVLLLKETINVIEEVKEYINKHYKNPCEVLAFVPNDEGGSCHPYYTAHEENAKLLVNAVNKLARK